MPLPVPQSVRSPTRSPWIRPLIGLAALSGCAGGLAALQPDLLLVESVEIDGACRADVAALRHLVDIRNGTRLWQVDPVDAARKAEAHPWVRAASVRRVWPDRVVVQVEEHQPVALLALGDVYYVDRYGEVFLPSRSDDLDYPVLTGIDPSLERMHPELPRLVIRDALALLIELDERGLVATERVSEIGFSPSRGFTMQLDTGARVLFGLDGHTRQIERLDALLASHVDLTESVHVDLVPDKVAIVRPLEGGGEG